MEQPHAIAVEPAREDAVDALSDLDRAIVGDDSRRAFLVDAAAAGRCFVARRGTRSVGFAVFEQSFFGQGFISLLAVHPDHRRLGVATALMRRIEADCPTDKLFTSTNASNLPMQRVCEALGFVRSGRINNLDEGDPEIIYFKRPSRPGGATVTPRA